MAFNPQRYVRGFMLSIAIVGVAAWFLGPLPIGLAPIAGTFKVVVD